MIARDMRMGNPNATRELARQLADDVRRRRPDALDLAGIDLGPALEQALLLWLRSGAPYARRSGIRVALRAVLAMGGGIGRTSSAREPVIVAVVQVPIHATLLASVADPLRELTGARLLRVGVGQGRQLRAVVDVATRRIAARWVSPLLSHGRAVARAELRGEAHGLADDAAGAERKVKEALPRLALLAAQLDSVVRRVEPLAVVAFNEVGVLGRIVPEVARKIGVPSVDLPHAEAADPEAARGLAYDAVGAYGPKSAAVLRQAGIPDARIRIVGPIRYDSLVARKAAVRTESRRLIYASQPTRPGIPQLSIAHKRQALAAAVRMAAVVPSSRLVVVPHPTESPSELAALLDADLTRATDVRIEPCDLHELLVGAWLLVTVTSQSVFDAAIAGVPGIMLDFTAAPSPVTYADEGFAILATRPEQALTVVGSLLDERTRDDAISRATTALEARFGSVDGKAGLRAAQLIADVAMRRRGTDR